jgi:hypothetical protein
MTARVVGIKVCANEKMNVVRLQSDRTQTVDDKIIFGHFDSQTAVQFRRICREIKRKAAVNQNVRAVIGLNKICRDGYNTGLHCGELHQV